MIARLGLRSWKSMPLWLIMLAIVGVPFAVNPVRMAKEDNERHQCTNNLKQIALGLYNYASVFGSLPPAGLGPESIPAGERISWLLGFGPFLESQPMWRSINHDRPWDDACHAALRQAHMRILDCPSVTNPVRADGSFSTFYVGITGVGPDSATLPATHRRSGAFGITRTISFSDIADGLSTTMVVSETSQIQGAWIQAGAATTRAVDPAERPYIGPNRPFGGNHRGGAYVLFADGSVRFAKDGVNPTVFESMATINGNDPYRMGELDGD